VTLPDTQNTVRQYITATKATGTFLFDCGQMTASYLQITPQNNTIHVPRLLLVDKNGYIRRDISEQTPNGFTAEHIAGAVDQLLK
jgi:hypothetical protein